MKRILTLAALILATPATADTWVNGYTRQDGTYVAPHYRSNPDGNRFNNYSSQGMTNPYTGQRGSRPIGAPAARRWPGNVARRNPKAGSVRR